MVRKTSLGATPAKSTKHGPTLHEKTTSAHRPDLPAGEGEKGRLRGGGRTSTDTEEGERRREKMWVL